MPELLPAVVDDLEKVPEPLRPYYTEEKGKDGTTGFVLNTEVEKHPKTHGLRTALDTERTSRKDLEKETKKWQGLGLSFEEAQKLAKKGKSADDQDHDDDEEPVAGMIPARVAAKKIKAAQDAAAAEKQNADKYRGLFTGKVAEDAITSAFLKVGGIPEDADIVRQIVRSRFEATDEGKVAILDDDGDRTDLTPEKFFEAFREKRPKFFTGTGSSGGGANPSNAGGSGGSVPELPDNATAAQVSAYIQKYGLPAFEKEVARKAIAATAKGPATKR